MFNSMMTLTVASLSVLQITSVASNLETPEGPIIFVASLLGLVSSVMAWIWKELE